MLSRCVVVPRSKGETIRKKLSEEGLLRKDLRIVSSEKDIYIPIAVGPDDEIELCFPMTEMDFEVVEQIASYKELANIPEDLKELLPSSFDIIGDICILKLADELLPHSQNIGEAILKANTNLNVVALDGGVKGEFRTRDLEMIAGEERTTTTHKEFGLRFEMDVGKVYFSPRLARERKRVADLVIEGETILDMFAGVGPFSIMIAKHSRPREIHAIDINPDAVEYLEKNIKTNKVDYISHYLGDARSVICGIPNADRIIMNLPHSAIDFLGTGLDVLQPGGIIHLYSIVENDELSELSQKVKELAKGFGHEVKVDKTRMVHTYSPTSGLYVFDLLSLL